MWKTHDPNHLCAHGHKLWWNYGDGKPRHIINDALSMQICNNPDED